MLERVVLFGASGDLAARLLLPALAELEQEGVLPARLAVQGVDVEPFTTGQFRDHAGAALAEHAAAVTPAARDALRDRLTYRRGDVTDPGDVAGAVGDEAVVAYLALPAGLFAPTLAALAAAPLARGSVIAIEKPFGTDLASARALNGLLAGRFPGCTVFRNDHFLHAQTVQNVLGLRFGNRILEPVWNADHVQQVEIVWDETLALEGRAAYYDRAGALRDMLQNHLLQILALTAMEQPASLGERDLRDAKQAVLRAVRPPSAAAIAATTVRGRYTAGTVDGHAVPAYVDEPGVDPGRGTETFAQVTLRVDNPRWAGVPFTLRSGKALGARRASITVHFREVAHPEFRGLGGRANLLQVSLGSPRVSLGLNVNAEGELFALTPVQVSTDLPAPARSAYAGLLLDILRGDPTLSVRGDEAEESWRIVDPVLDAWAVNAVPLTDYVAGSEGPSPHRGAGTRRPGRPPAELWPG